MFRSLLFIEYFRRDNIDYLVLVNNDPASIAIYNDNKINYKIVDYNDDMNWVIDIIHEYSPDVWINDKFITDEKMARILSESGTLFCMMDESGEFDFLADIHFAGMIYPSKKNVKGKKLYYGEKYIIINKEVDNYKRKREKLERIIVTLGGSDPFGVTVEVIKELSKYDYDVDVVIGPNYRYLDELNTVNIKNYNVYTRVPSLVAMMAEYDLIISGGGFTCVEAAASGLPSVIIANAPHEVFTGRFMQEKGCSIYAGEHGLWDRNIVKNLSNIDISGLSENGLNRFDTNALERIMNTICKMRGGY